MAINTNKIKEIEINEVDHDHSGDRICVDLSCKLEENEGLLVGNFSRGLFLINNERSPKEDEYDIEPRPFRVNAGVISSYIFMPNEKTKYLSELKIGDKVLTIKPNGDRRIVEVARLKIEKRPMTLIKGIHKYDKEIPIKDEEDINYFSTYRKIFKWYDDDTREQIFKINDLRNYIGHKLHIEMDVATFIQTAETVRLIEAPNENPISITSLEPGMSVYAWINNPTLKGRHFGTVYDGFCLEV